MDEKDTFMGTMCCALIGGLILLSFSIIGSVFYKDVDSWENRISSLEITPDNLIFDNELVPQSLSGKYYVWDLTTNTTENWILNNNLAKLSDPEMDFIIIAKSEKFYAGDYKRENLIPVKVYGEKLFVIIIHWPSKKIIGKMFFSKNPPAEFKQGVFTVGDIVENEYKYSAIGELSKWIESKG